MFPLRRSLRHIKCWPVCFGPRTRTFEIVVKMGSVTLIRGKYSSLAIFRRLRAHFSIRNAGLLLLTISSAIYFICFTQPTTTIFIDQVEDTIVTAPLFLSSSNLPLSHKQLFVAENISKNELKQIVTLLEKEQEIVRHTNSSLIKILQLLEKERNHADYSSNQTFEDHKKMLDSHREFFKYAALVLRNTAYPGVENYTRYAVARLGLLPLANAEPLKPEFGPVINDVLSFRYPITIQPCPNVTVNPSVFVAVISAPSNFEKRQMIRKTWKNHLKAESEKGLLVTAGFGFIVGLTVNNVTQAKIEEESQLYGDIIQIGVSDFYRNLPFKLTGLFNWLYRHCSKVDFLFKVDDDIYVNVRNLIHFVRSYHPSNGTIFGLPAGYLNSMRAGKWSITYEEWPWKSYPKYYFGPAALIHGSAFLPLLAAFQTTPLMPFEDVYYSGICREKAGIEIRYPSSQFKVLALGQPKVPMACDLRHFIAWLTVSGNHLNNSHVATDDFYHNRTRCIVKDSKGMNSTIDPNEPVQFYFH